MIDLGVSGANLTSLILPQAGSYPIGDHKEEGRISSTSPQIKKVDTSVREFEKAVDLFNKGKTEEVIRILKKLVSKKPKWIEARRILAAAYHRIGKIDAAIAEFKKVIELEPKNAENYFYLGLLYRSIEQNDLAIDSFERALHLDPAKLQYKKQLSEIYYTQAFTCYNSLNVSRKSWKKMIADLEKAIKFNSDNEDAHLLLAEIYEEIADVWRDQGSDVQAKLYYEIAESEYLKVLELNPKSKVEFNLAKVYFNLGKYQLSRKYLSQYLEHYQDAEAQELMRQIELKLKEKGE